MDLNARFWSTILALSLLLSVALGIQNVHLRHRLVTEREHANLNDLATKETSVPVVDLGRVAGPLVVFRPSSMRRQGQTTTDRGELPAMVERSTSLGDTLITAAVDRLLGGSAEYTLFVFTTPQDCPQCLGASLDWNELAEKYSAKLRVVAIVAIIDQCSLNDAKIFADRETLNFPVIYDHESVLRSVFAINGTPATVLVAKDGRQILNSSHVVRDSDQHQLLTAIEATVK